MRYRNLYRGWSVLGGLFLTYAATNGILMHTLPLLYPDLIDEFGWSESAVTLPATALFVIGALSSPPSGILLDRFSARKIIATGIVGIVVGLAAFSFVDSLWQMICIYALFAISLSLSGLVSNMLVLTRWFARLRGRATGILLMASSAGGAVFPLVLGASVLAYGWRGSLLVFALIAATMTIPPLLFVIRDRPSDLGLLIDGDHAPDSESNQDRSAAQIPGVTFRQAVTHIEFYMLALATAAVWFAIIALVQHQSIYLARDLGVDRALLPSVFSAFFAFSVLGKFGFGWLSDHLDKCYAMIASVLVLIAGFFLLRNIDPDSNRSLFTYAVVAGIGFSGAFTMIQLLIARFYAGASYGKILATMTLMDTLAGALGTQVVGRMRTSTGTYLPAIDVMIACCVFAIVCIWIVRHRNLYKVTGNIQQAT